MVFCAAVWVKLAPARPEKAMTAQPNRAAMATVPSRTAITTPEILPNLSVTLAWVKAFTIETKISGMISILSRAM